MTQSEICYSVHTSTMIDTWLGRVAYCDQHSSLNECGWVLWILQVCRDWWWMYRLSRTTSNWGELWFPLVFFAACWSALTHYIIPLSKQTLKKDSCLSVMLILYYGSGPVPPGKHQRLTLLWFQWQLLFHHLAFGSILSLMCFVFYRCIYSVVLALFFNV